MKFRGVGRGRRCGDDFGRRARVFAVLLTGAALSVCLVGCGGLNPANPDGSFPDVAVTSEVGDGRNGPPGASGDATARSDRDNPDTQVVDAAAPEDGASVSSFDVVIEPDEDASVDLDAASDLPETEPVPVADPLTIVVAPHKSVRVVHEAVAFMATLVASDGTPRDISRLVTWQSSSPEVASIDATGLAKAISIGKTEISAHLGTLEGRESLAVVGPGFEGVTIEPATATIGVVGNTQAFKATMMFSNGDNVDITAAVAWVSSRPDVAIISNLPGSWGVAIAIGPGQTEISFNTFGFAAHATLTVPPPPAPTP